MTLPYEAALRALRAVDARRGMQLGLENMHALHRLLGAPLARVPVVHIAGTNGKGSTCWKVAGSWPSTSSSLVASTA